jgi:hypothetical protein
MVRTATHGFHRYLAVPKCFPIRTRVALWPGIDILAAGSSVVLPGSRTDDGEYCELRTFEECAIPEAPREFVRLIRALQRKENSANQPRAKLTDLYAEADTSDVSKRQWCLLFRNKVFRSFWRRQGKAGDATDSAYEYHLAKACFCCGLNHHQAESVILNWRRKHGLQRDIRQLRLGIIPRAWAEVKPWVERWRAELEADSQSKDAAKTSNMILAHMSAGRPQTPSSIAAGLGIPRERAKKAMQRMESEGQLTRTPLGYRIVTNGDISMYHYSL